MAVGTEVDQPLRTDPGPDRRRQAFAVALLVVPAVALAVAGWDRRWMSDDGFINLRIVAQVLDGNGPVFNAGERIEAATSPAWIAVLVLASVLPFSLEWTAVILGLGLSVAGLVMGQLAALRLLPPDERHRLVVPAGALVVAALPPFWDFATSGLETGLSLAWLGACALVLARSSDVVVEATHPGARRGRIGVAVLIGLGPVVRPDFALLSAVFLAVLLVLRRSAPRRALVQTVAVALALPVAYQVFRMAYFAAIVPNTAFAKEGTEAQWDVGWTYLGDLVSPYWLWLPLGVLLGVAWAPRLAESVRRCQLDAGVALTAPVLGGVLHGLYVVRVGGDFMHSRLLLPALFLVLVPVMVVTVARPVLAVAAAVAVGWAVLCAASLSVPYAGRIGPEAIADERALYSEAAGRANPVSLGDYGGNPWTGLGRSARRAAAGGERVLRIGGQDPAEPLIRVGEATGSSSPVVVQALNIGLLGYAAGTDVHVVDSYGLADPIGGRLSIDERGRPGHEKRLDQAWSLARFAASPGPYPPGAPAVADVAAARNALSCGDLAQLLAAVDEPLTPRRMARNAVLSLRLHDFRLPSSPAEAGEALCSSDG